MKLIDLLEAESNQDLDKLLSIIKKIEPKAYKSASQLESAIKDSTIAFNVGKGKSIWAGDKHAPAGSILFVDWNQSGNVKDYGDEKTHKYGVSLKEKGTSIDEIVSLFKKLGIKQDKKVKIAFG